MIIAYTRPRYQVSIHRTITEPLVLWFLSHWGYLEKKILQKCSLSSPLLLSKSLNLIGCHGGYIKMLKNLFRNCKVDKADTLHTC